MRSRDRERVATVLFFAALAVLAYLVFLIARPFLSPLGWAVVLVTAFHPVHMRFERRRGRVRAAAASTITLAVIVVAPVLVVMMAFVGEAVQAGADLQQAVADGRLAWTERTWAWLQHWAIDRPQIDVAGAAVDTARQIVAALAARAAAVLQNVALFLVDLFVTLFATFFLFRDREALMHAIRRAVPLDELLRERMIGQTAKLVSATLSSAALVAGVQGLLGGVLFAAVGIDAPVFWGVVMAFLCVLPFGAWVVWMPAAAWFIAAGDLWRGLVLAGLGFGVVSAVDNFLRPALLSGQARMNGLLVFISLLGGLRVFGSLGLVLGPTLVATAIGIVRAYTDSDVHEDLSGAA